MVILSLMTTTAVAERMPESLRPVVQNRLHHYPKQAGTSSLPRRSSPMSPAAIHCRWQRPARLPKALSRVKVLTLRCHNCPAAIRKTSSTSAARTSSASPDGASFAERRSWPVGNGRLSRDSAHRPRASAFMHIGIDAHAIGARQGGNETYIGNLIAALAELDQENRYTVYLSQPRAAEQWRGRYPNFEVKLLPEPTPLVRVPVALAFELRRRTVDVLHVQYTAPPF